MRFGSGYFRSFFILIHVRFHPYSCSAAARSTSSDAGRGCTTCWLVVIPGYSPVLRVHALVRWTAYVANHNVMVATTSGQDWSCIRALRGKRILVITDLFARHTMHIFTKMTCDGCVSTFSYNELNLHHSAYILLNLTLDAIRKVCTACTNLCTTCTILGQ